MAIAVTATDTSLKLFRDFTFHSLNLLDMFTFPVKSLAAQNRQEVGAAFFDTDENLVYVSLGATWSPQLAAVTDVGTSIVLTAPSISLTSDVNDINLTSADAVIFATGAGGISFPKATVSQATNINTAVTINSSAGVITTVAATTAVTSADRFTVNNNRVSAASVVHVTLVQYEGGGGYGADGLPAVAVGSISNGAFTIDVINTSTANPLAGAIKIAFTVV